MATSYSNYNQSQYDNQAKYLNNLINSGSSGQAAWAKNELNSLNSQYKQNNTNTGGNTAKNNNTVSNGNTGTSNTNYSNYNQSQYNNQSKYLNNLINSGSSGQATWAKQELQNLNSQYKQNNTNTGTTVPTNTNTALSKVLADNGFSNDIYGKAKYVDSILNGVGTKNPITGNTVTQDDAVKYLESLGLKVSGSTNGGQALIVSDGDKFNQWYLMNGGGYSRGGANGSTMDMGNGTSANFIDIINYGNYASGTGTKEQNNTSDYDNQKLYLTNLINNGTQGQAAWAKAQLEQLVAGNGSTTQGRTNATSEGLSLENQKAYLNNLIKNGTQGEATWAEAQLKELAQYDNQKLYLTNLINNGTAGQKAWAEAQLKELQNSAGALNTSGSNTNYTGLTPEQYANQKAYLENLINNGTTGQATWAYKELQNLNASNASLGKDGYWYYNSGTGTGNGGAPVRNDYSQLINDTYNTQAELYKQANELATQAAVKKLEDTYQNSLAKYQTMRDQTSIDTAKALDTQALMSQLNGDYGGLGNKQYGVLQAAGAAQLQQINLEQQNLLNTTKQQIAQLEMEGKIEEAKMLAELAQSQMEALINEGDKVYESLFNAYKTNKDVQFKEAELLGTYNGQDTAATKQQNLENALTRLQMGIFSESDAKALGISADQAKQYADYINTLARLDLEKAKAEIAYTKRRGTSSDGDGLGGLYVGGNDYSKMNIDQLLAEKSYLKDTIANGTEEEKLTAQANLQEVYKYIMEKRPLFTGSTYEEAVAYNRIYGDDDDAERASSIYTQSEFMRKKNTGESRVSGTDNPLSNFKTYRDYLLQVTGSL